jgi:hypothetical protein
MHKGKIKHNIIAYMKPSGGADVREPDFVDVEAELLDLEHSEREHQDERGGRDAAGSASAGPQCKKFRISVAEMIGLELRIWLVFAAE